MKDSDVEAATTKLTESSEEITDEMGKLTDQIKELTNHMGTVADEFSEFSRAGPDVNSHTISVTEATQTHRQVADD